MATRLHKAFHQLCESVYLKDLEQSSVDASRGHVSEDELDDLLRKLDSAKGDVSNTFDPFIEAVPQVVADQGAPVVYPGPSDGQVLAALRLEVAFPLLQELLNTAQWESQRRVVAALPSSGRWLVKGGWQRYTLGTWALLALQFGVTAGSVVLCAATPAGDSRWAAVGVALTVVAATACVVLPAVSKDDQQRREVTAAIKQLERSTQAALQLARQLRQRRMWRSWKKVYGLFLKMNLTVSQVRGMRVA